MLDYWRKLQKARLVASALYGSWRSSPTPPQISVRELEQITPLLIQSGAGALVWWRIRNSPFTSTGAGAELQQAYRLHRLEAGVHLQKIKRVRAHLRAVGIEPVLVKGWSVARLYPKAGLRHFIDVDLCVRSDQHAKAQQLLANLGDEGLYVDLHRELDHLDVMEWDEFWARTQLVSLCSPCPSDESPANKIHHEGTEDTERIRVPCAEDHLRILCIHWLRHGAWKAAGLCDIAVALESRPVDFDWQRCLGSDPVRAGWVACTIALARELLGAKSEGQRAKVEGERGEGPATSLPLTPYPLPLAPLPRWLVPAVLRQWSRSQSPNTRYQALPALLNHTSNWKEVMNEIYSRLDQPVRATVALHGRFNNWPRLLYQLGELLLHSPEVPKQLALMIGQFEFPRLRRPDARQVSDLPTS